MTNAMFSPEDDQPLVTQTAAKIREMLITGELLPGTKLSEQQISAQFGISRNTLREVFRLLTSQSLLTYIPNRGVFVATPDEATVVDIYRVRRVIQKGAVQIAVPAHPALERMNALLEQAVLEQKNGNWRQVGTINMEFHRAMVELCDSTRLSACFDLVLAELRLVFAQLEDNAHLHESYIALNAELLGSLHAGNNEIAAQQLDSYLLSSERSVLAALQRKKRNKDGALLR